MKRALTLITIGLGLCLAHTPAAEACTNILVTKGASTDGSSFITYAADSHTLYGELYFTPGGVHPAGSTVEVLDWDTSKYLGRIPQAERTYTVVGNMNESQVSIGETTFGGREELLNPDGKIDYGSLMYLGLARARTAREAIKVMTELAEAHTYSSAGETFSIADPDEVWLLEMIGTGKGGKGAVWVARRIPDGYISAHANHSRIRQFPLTDKRDTLYSKNVISFARDKGYFKGKDAEFSFQGTYAPADYGALRFCEGRVWQIFRRAAPELNLSMDYVKGVVGAEPMPLWIKAKKKLSLTDVKELMRDHFEGTEWDLSKGVGAGPYSVPYRWRPMEWEVDKKKYVHDRAVSTQQTGFSFVSQMRRKLPNPIGGVLWFGVDDTFMTVYVPIYCGVREVPKSFAVGTGSWKEFTWDSAFWVFNFVANWTYSRYSDMIIDVQAVQRELEGKFVDMQPEIERAAVDLYRRSPELARDYLTSYSVEQGNATVARWRKLGEQLLMKYMDGNVRDPQGNVLHPAYPDSWYRRIIQENGANYQWKDLPGAPPPPSH